MSYKHFDGSPLSGLCTTLLGILLNWITVSGVVSTIFYAALGGATTWVMNIVLTRFRHYLMNRKQKQSKK